MNEDYVTLDDPEGKNVYCNTHRKYMLATRKRLSAKKRKFSDFKKQAPNENKHALSETPTQTKVSRRDVIGTGLLAQVPDIETNFIELEKQRIRNIAEIRKIKR